MSAQVLHAGQCATAGPLAGDDQAAGAGRCRGCGGESGGERGRRGMRDRVVDGPSNPGAGGRGRGVPRGADGDDRDRRDPGGPRLHGAVAAVRSVDDLDRGPGPGTARGIIGLAFGRSGECVEDWIALQSNDFRDAARVLAIDPSAP